MLWLRAKKEVGLLSGLALVLPGWLAMHDVADARGVSVPGVAVSEIAAASPAVDFIGIDYAYPMVAGSRSAAAMLLRTDDATAAGGLPRIAPAADDLHDSGLLRNFGQKMRQYKDRAVSAEGVAQMAASVQGGSNSSDIIASVGNSITQAAIDTGLQRVEEEFCCNGIVRNINLSWSPGYSGRPSVVQADAVFAALDSDRVAAMVQLGLQSRDSEAAGNTGVIMRTRLSPEVLLGVNVFYDYLSEPRMDRWSIGADVRGRWVGVSTNYYSAISDPKTIGRTQVYTPDGFDLELSGQVPSMPWVGYAARYYSWDKTGEKNLTGAEYTLSMTPMSMITLKAKYDRPETGKDDFGFEAELRYNFYQTLDKQIGYQGVVPAEDVWQQRFSRVRREYEQRIQRRQVVPQTLREVPCNAFIQGQACISMVSVPQGATSVVIKAPAVPGSTSVESPGRSSLLRVTPGFCLAASILSASGCLLQNPRTGDTVRIIELAPGATYTPSFSYYDISNPTPSTTPLATPSISITAEGNNVQVGVTATPGNIAETTGGTGTSTITLTTTSEPTTNRPPLRVAFTIAGGDLGTDYSLTMPDGTPATSPVSIEPPPTPGTSATLALTLTALNDSDTVNENIVFTITPAIDNSYGRSTASATIIINDDDDPLNSDSTLSGLTFSPALTLVPPFSPAIRNYTATVGGNDASIQVVSATATDFRAMGVAVLDVNDNNVGLNTPVALAEESTTTIKVRVTAENATTSDYTIEVTRPAAPSLDVSFAQSALSVSESSGTHSIQVTISQSTHPAFTLRLSRRGDATDGVDYNATGLIGSGPAYTINVAQNVTSVAIGVAIVDDDIDEADETVVYEITTDAAYTITTSMVTLTIQDDDTRGVTINTTTVNVTEGSTATYSPGNDNPDQ